MAKSKNFDRPAETGEVPNLTAEEQNNLAFQVEIEAEFREELRQAFKDEYKTLMARLRLSEQTSRGIMKQMLELRDTFKRGDYMPNGAPVLRGYLGQPKGMD